MPVAQREHSQQTWAPKPEGVSTAPASPTAAVASEHLVTAHCALQPQKVHRLYGQDQQRHWGLSLADSLGFTRWGKKISDLEITKLKLLPIWRHSYLALCSNTHVNQAACKAFSLGHSVTLRPMLSEVGIATSLTWWFLTLLHIALCKETSLHFKDIARFWDKQFIKEKKKKACLFKPYKPFANKLFIILLWSTGRFSTPKLLKFHSHLCPFQDADAFVVQSWSIVQGV